MIMGSIGPGKFNFLGLIFRMITSASGRILMNGDDLSKPQMQRNIGYAPQFAHMLEGTIAASVAFGIERGRNFITQMPTVAHFSDRLKSLPQGTDSWTGEARTSLSAEQRQWLGITEAPYHFLTALVPDEALYMGTQHAFLTLLTDLLWFPTILSVTQKIKTMHFFRLIRSLLRALDFCS